ncbi:hypothetical protein BCR36DRAFT_588110 [Piromyces finnis]|uniref:Uncharacterized protein n=1 Tax=Piromyces finnis TaxID=1754191 RepID=A0A1Y1UTI3_9FUNG|nr:hypothetical protein BCR36DRAFT_588110 [Piromyces finnis]|eukprot:ORX41330.1 hypothetical protein BCR36DRAFT_588110 [Piromyces finnis]
METLYQYNIFNSSVPTEPIMDNTILKSKKIIKQKNFKKVHFAENITLEYTYSSDIYDRTPFEDDDYEMECSNTIQKPVVFNQILDDIDFEIIYNNNNVHLTIYNTNSYEDDDQDSVIDFDDFEDFEDFDDYAF